MRITLLSIIVDDQPKALAFYRDVLGFVVKQDVPTGPPGAPHWITLAAPDRLDGACISLEPNFFPYVKTYQAALKENGVPLTAFEVDDIATEHARLSAAGVVFKGPPSQGDAAMPSMATFDDTVGNWIMLYEKPKG
ncbi:VOC family protein [Sphingomonas psychrotolerans]|uniref:VOC family protein n=1 Tax=Sphingomonas psychrotolerans TaxID=1327635 RepID=A0ABU3N8I4_9SPHN|nr:VOC family protein [Sphingomonas psychrotolerans]MDT8760792.1 VOC family protein [Sphingomonas psychrotolerans]